MTARQLEQVYRREAKLDFFKPSDDVNDDGVQGGDEDDFVEDLFNEKAQGILDEERTNEMKHVLQEIEEVACAEHSLFEDLEQVGHENMKIPNDPDSTLPDAKELQGLTSSAGTDDNNDFEDVSKFPRTLKEALGPDRETWIGLWQLAVFLRCGKGGMDGKFLRKGEVVRKRSRKLNWHQSFNSIMMGPVLPL